MDREIQEKQTKIEYVRTCANYLLGKTVDARGLSINMNELTKFCQQLRDLTKRIKRLKQKLMNPNDVSAKNIVEKKNIFSFSFNWIYLLRLVHRHFTNHSIRLHLHTNV